MRSHTFVPWLGIAILCSALMWMVPGQETVPYHIGYAAFALCFGIGPWTVAQTTVSLLTYTATSGAILLYRASTDVIAWEETAEIPLMLVLVLLMVWLVRRRQRALDTLKAVSERERRDAHARDLLTQRSSHEMRSPLTIARGYLEVMRSRPRDTGEAEELRIIDEELGRLTRVCERLVRSFSVQGEPLTELIDLDAILGQTAQRWSTVADRRWIVDSDAGSLMGSAERIRACLDTLVENAVRYTGRDDRVRIFGSADQSVGEVRLGVADSGPGLSDEQIDQINSPGVADTQVSELTPARDELSQTGLGLGLVLDIVRARGGRLEAGHAPEGGALLVMVLPIARPHPSREAAVLGALDADRSRARRLLAS